MYINYVVFIFAKVISTECASLYPPPLAQATYPGLEEPLKDLQLLLGPGPGVLGRDLQLEGLVVLGVERHAALQHLRLEHDDARLVGVHDGQLQGGERGEEDQGQSKGRKLN